MGARANEVLAVIECRAEDDLGEAWSDAARRAAALARRRRGRHPDVLELLRRPKRAYSGMMDDLERGWTGHATGTYRGLGEGDSLRETWSPAARAAALLARRRTHVAGKRDAVELDDHTRAVGALRHGQHHDFGNGVAVHMRTSDEGDDHLSIHVDGKKDSEVRLHDSYAASGQIRQTARDAHQIARSRRRA